MDEGALHELAASISVHGMIQPILVRPDGSGRFEIIAGERRWRAAQLAGLDQVPVIQREVADEQALSIALIENIQREDLNPLEEAQAIQRLIDEFHFTHERCAEAIGRSRSATSNLLRLLNLAESVQALLLAGDLDMGHARALLPLAKSEQLVLGQRILKNGLTTADTERRVAKLLHEISKKVPASVDADSDISRLEHKLSKKLGLPVTIKHGRKGNGQVAFSYKSLDDLNRIIKLL